MISAAACHGAWHCKSLAAWSGQDTVVVLVAVVIAVLILVVKRMS